MNRSDITTRTLAPELTGAILGVPGRFLPVAGGETRGRPVIRSQQFTSEWRSSPALAEAYGPGAKMRVNIRFDDESRNGRETFSIAADVITAESHRKDAAACGRLHDDICQFFPELADLIQWHLCSTDGPMHYPGNAVYLAGDRDYHGLRKGEQRQIVSPKGPVWERRLFTPGGAEVKPVAGLTPTHHGDAPPTETTETLIIRWFPVMRTGKGKDRELDAARRAAIWPEATDADLMRRDLREALMARLPDLMQRFKAAMLAAGLRYPEEA